MSIAAAVSTLLDQFHARRPARVWSLVVTLYGDAIVPRGGVLWLGSLTEIMGLFRIDPGHLRTAMSRLTADGWVERVRIGRNSYYRFSERADGSFAAATKRIYFPHAPTFDGRLRLALFGAGNDGRTELRARLETAGFVPLSPPAYVGLGAPAIPQTEGLFVVAIDADEQARGIVASAWKLAPIADAYHSFVARFAPLEAALSRAEAVAPADALVARTLLIHEFRRIVLRDPGLPPALLPPDWPGTAARQLAGRLYRHLVAPAETFLDGHAQNESGPLPPPNADFARRFTAECG